MNDKSSISFDFIENSFSNDAIVSYYENAVTSVGLWDSEKILAMKYFGKLERILIAGCGAGRVPFGLINNGFKDIYGIDLSKSMIQKAIEFSKKHSIDANFLNGNILNMPYANSFFNGIFMPYNVLMHIPLHHNRLKVLSEIKRILSKESYFIFTTHNDRDASPEWSDFWMEEKAKWIKGLNDKQLIEFGDRIVPDKGSKIFMHFPTNEEVSQLVEEARFQIIDTKLRSEICKESSSVLNFSLDCRFWIVTSLPD